MDHYLKVIEQRDNLLHKIEIFLEERENGRLITKFDDITVKHQKSEFSQIDDLLHGKDKEFADLFVD